MRQRNLTRIILIISLATLVGGCAVKYERRIFRLKNPEYVESLTGPRIYKYEIGNVSLEVNSILMWDRTLAWGPPLMPVFAGADPKSPYQLWFSVTVDSPSDTTVMDFSRVHIENPGGKISPLQSIYVRKSEELIQVAIGKDTVSNEKKRYHLTFVDIPSDVDEFLVNLGSIEIHGEEHEVPALRYGSKRTEGYIPFNLH